MIQKIPYGWGPRALQTYGDINAANIFRADGLYGSVMCNAPGRTSAATTQDVKHRVVWTEEEDRVLRELILKHGTNKWSLIASKIPFKNNKHCRRRWQACLNVLGNKGVWTAAEDAKLLEGHRMFGNRWTEIAKLVPGRTDNAAKNRFMAITKRDAASAADDSGLSDAALASPVRSKDVTSRAPACLKRPRPGGFGEEAVCRKRAAADLDLNAHWRVACPSGSEASEVSQEGEEWAESAHPQAAAPRAWIDLNVMYVE